MEQRSQYHPRPWVCRAEREARRAQGEVSPTYVGLNRGVKMDARSVTVVSPTSVGLNRTKAVRDIAMHKVSPTDVGLNRSIHISMKSQPTVSPTDVGLNRGVYNTLVTSLHRITHVRGFESNELYKHQL